MSLSSAPHWKAKPPLDEGAESGNPVQYEIDYKSGIVHVRLGHEVRADDITRYADELRKHPRFQSAFSEIVDLREVQQLELNAADFLELADRIDPFSPDAKRAFVVRNAVQNHAARMHKILHGKRHFEIFNSIEDAEAWVRS